MTLFAPASRGPVHSAGAASAVPMLVGVASFVVSLVLAIIAIAALSIPVAILFDIPLPVVSPEHWWISLIGYILTPVVACVCIGWDATAQRKGLRQNANFQIRPQYGRILRWVTVASLVLGVWHILNLSVPLSEGMGLS